MMDYESPEDCAKFMFDYIWKHITTYLLKNHESEILSNRQIMNFHHQAFMKSRSSIYIGGDEYFQKLEESKKGKQAPLVVIGETGIGKSALLATWLARKEQLDNVNLIYHFVGCTEESANLRHLLTRITDGLDVLLNTNNQPERNKERSDKVVKTVTQIARDITIKLKEYDKMNTPLVIVVDGLNKIKSSKTGRPGYWIPKDIFQNVTIVVSTTISDDSTITELCELNSFQSLKVNDITEIEERLLCDRLLKENSKVLNEETIDVICSGRNTNNPLFLRIVIDELCVYGNFRILSKQIEHLKKCKNVKEIFIKFLDRIEEDFKKKSLDDILIKVISVLATSVIGLSEEDFIMLLNVSSSVWSAIYFALERYLISRNGKLSIAYDELIEAATDKYLSKPRMKYEIMMLLANFYEQVYHNSWTSKRRGFVEINSLPDTAIFELVRLLHVSKQYTKLRQFIENINVLRLLIIRNEYELMEYWRAMNIDSLVLAKRYMTAISKWAVYNYMDLLVDDSQNEAVKRTVITLQRLGNFLNNCKHFNAAIVVMFRVQRLVCISPFYTGDKELGYRAWIQYKIACLLSDAERYKESIEMHKANMIAKQTLRNKKSSEYDSEELGMSYHGLAVSYGGNEQYEEAIKWYQASIRHHYSRDKYDMSDISKSFNNIGTCLIKLQKYKDAMKALQLAMRIEKDYYYGEMPPDVSYTMHNIGLCYRKLKDLDNAELWYLRSLKIKVNAFGWDDPDVALAHMNLGTLNLHRKCYSKAEDHFHKCLAINRKYYKADGEKTVMALENLAMVLAMQDKMEEGEQYFLPARQKLIDINRLDKGLPGLNRRYARWYEKMGKREQARDIWKSLVERSNAKAVDVMNLWEHLEKYNDKIEDVYSAKTATTKFPCSQHIRAAIVDTALGVKNFAEITNQISEFIEVEKDENQRKTFVIAIIETLDEEGYLKEAHSMLDTLLERFKNEKDMLKSVKSTLKELSLKDDLTENEDR